MTSEPSNPRIPLTAAPPGGFQFSVWDLGCFLVACAAMFGWLRFVFARVDGEHLPGFEHPQFLTALLYWPLPMAILALFPRRDPGEAAPGLTGHALWRLTGVLYPTAYLAVSVAQVPAGGTWWALAVGILSTATVCFVAWGALVLWECGGSNYPASRVQWVGMSLYLYLLVALTCSTLIAFLYRRP